MAADRELSEDQEGELYRHYGVPYSRADSPSGLPAGEPEPDAEPAVSDGEREPAGEPVAISTPEVATGKPQVRAEEPTTAAQEPLPAGLAVADAARPEAAASESAPIPATAVGSAPGPVDEPAVPSDGVVASRRGSSPPPGLGRPPRRLPWRLGSGGAGPSVGSWARRWSGLGPSQQRSAAGGVGGAGPRPSTRQWPQRPSRPRRWPGGRPACSPARPCCR